MIQVQDLRVGNKVKCKTSNDAGIYTVLALDGLNLKIYLTEPRNKWHTEDLIKPIELTEDILLKCGFKVLENQPRKWFKIKTKKRGVSLEICFSSKRIVLNNGYDFIDLLYVKYLHQLQNLYFALTNQELTINL